MYSLVFIGSSLLSFYLQFHLGKTRKIHPASLALALLLGSFFFIVFMKAPAIRDGLQPELVASVRYMMTGLFGGIIGLILSRYILKVDYQRLDDFAIAFPICVAIMKLGCFTAGCCFGTPAEYGIVPEPESTAANYYASLGVKNVHIHPVQLYESIGCLLFWPVVLGRRRIYKRQPGSLFLFAMLGYFMIRFGAEFFRESSAWQPIFLHLKMSHLVLLGMSLVLAVLLVRNQRQSLFAKVEKQAGLGYQWLVFIAVVAGFLSTRSLLHFIEQAVLVFEIVFALIVLSQHTLRQQPLFSTPTTIGLGLLFLLIGTAQAPKDSVMYKYKSVQLGFGNGRYTNRIDDRDGCNSSSNTFEQQYTVVGAGFAWTKVMRKSTSELSLSGWASSERQNWLSGSSQQSRMSFGNVGISFSARQDFRWIGYGGGLHLGNIRVADNQTNATILSKGYFDTPILPSAYIRVGPEKIFYGEYQYANLFPSPFPGFQHQIAFGTAFGIPYDFNMRLGGVGHGGRFLSFKIPIESLTIEPTYLWGGDYPTAPNVPTKQNSQFNISLRYHIGKPTTLQNK